MASRTVIIGKETIPNKFELKISPSGKTNCIEFSHIVNLIIAIKKEFTKEQDKHSIECTIENNELILRIEYGKRDPQW